MVIQNQTPKGCEPPVLFLTFLAAYKVGLLISTLQMRKQAQRGVQLAQGHTAGQWQGWVLCQIQSPQSPPLLQPPCSKVLFLLLG